ncbi:MAG: outer membrane lipoprotein-sorting protein [Gammaproteobacteria bacterium]|nr:outer membrane lipoprotein-sorting protein [Gammaproteobacteria bacterium]
MSTQSTKLSRSFVNKFLYRAVLLTVICPALAAAEAAAQPSAATPDQAASDAENRGKVIAIEADRRDSGYIDSESTIKMTLRDKKGRERVRTLRIKAMERPDDGDWSMTIFDEPADVEGTALLTYSHGLEPDDQWLYLPALKRVKRISSKNKSGPFMGSEFAFEDLSSFELEKYKFRYLRNETCGDDSCTVSEWVPVYDHSGYSRTEVWHDTNHYRTRRIDFFDRTGKPLKVLTLDNFKLHNERFWRAHHWLMVNHLTGKSTIIETEKIALGVGLDKRDFDKNSLKSAR